MGDSFRHIINNPNDLGLGALHWSFFKSIYPTMRMFTSVKINNMHNIIVLSIWSFLDMDAMYLEQYRTAIRDHTELDISASVV